MSFNRELYSVRFLQYVATLICVFFFFSNMAIKRILVWFLALLLDLVLFVWTAHYTATHSTMENREKQFAALITLYQSACMLLIFHARSQSSVICVLPYRLSGEYKKMEHPSVESNLAKGTLLHLYDEIHISH